MVVKYKKIFFFIFEKFLFSDPTRRDFLQESKRGKLTDDLVTKEGFQIDIPI